MSELTLCLAALMTLGRLLQLKMIYIVFKTLYITHLNVIICSSCFVKDFKKPFKNEQRV
jgi:hypothetical protein